MRLRWWKASKTPAEEGDPETLKLILDELTARVTRQIDGSKSIDTKAGILAGFAATAATFLAPRHVQPVLAGAAYAGYAVAFVFALAALAVTTYKDVPDARVLVNEYALEPKIKALRDLVVERTKALEANADKQAKKARRWWTAAVALGVGVVFSVLAVLVVHTDGRAQTSEKKAPRGGTGRSVTAIAGTSEGRPGSASHLHGEVRQLGVDGGDWRGHLGRRSGPETWA